MRWARIAHTIAFYQNKDERQLNRQGKGQSYQPGGMHAQCSNKPAEIVSKISSRSWSAFPATEPLTPLEGVALNNVDCDTATLNLRSDYDCTISTQAKIYH